MGKQYNKVEKRARRKRYNEKQKEKIKKVIKTKAKK
jgi:hypothetical protein